VTSCQVFEARGETFSAANRKQCGASWNHCCLLLRLDVAAKPAIWPAAGHLARSVRQQLFLSPQV
jgi:hypothetical protein